MLEPTEAAALTAVLEEIPSAAFVLWADGRIACVNRLGHSARELAPDSIDSGLLESLGGRSEAFRVTRILAPGAPRHFLAVQADAAVDPGPRLADAAARFGFTPRQTQVLGPAGARALEQGHRERAGLRGGNGGDPRHRPARQVGLREPPRAHVPRLVRAVRPGSDRRRVAPTTPGP